MLHPQPRGVNWGFAVSRGLVSSKSCLVLLFLSKSIPFCPKDAAGAAWVGQSSQGRLMEQPVWFPRTKPAHIRCVEKRKIHFIYIDQEMVVLK